MSSIHQIKSLFGRTHRRPGLKDSPQVRRKGIQTHNKKVNKVTGNKLSGVNTENITNIDSDPKTL